VGVTRERFLEKWMSGPLKVAIVGCGNISTGYAKTMQAHPGKLTLVGAFDTDRSRAEALVKTFGGKAYTTLDELLADPGVEAVCNLTIFAAHVPVITAALNAGKHVHTEKPIALDAGEAQALVRLAREKNLRLSSAPITFMGEAQQTAWKAIRTGRLGTVRVAYAEMNWGRPEKWHPNPAPFFEVGAFYDVGVYPLTLLTTILGPVQRVRAMGTILRPALTDKYGNAFSVTTPDWMCALLEFESGTIARLTVNFYIWESKQQQGVEFHGDQASLFLSTPHDFNGVVELRENGTPDWITLPPVREPYPGVEWARGLTELHDALRAGRPQRPTGAHAAHVVEIIQGVHRANESGEGVTIESRFTSPEPMEWAL